MPFQFYCPQGHLLEGHESQAGQQSQCPLCGSMFLIPGVAPGYAQPGPMGGVDPLAAFGAPPAQQPVAPQEAPPEPPPVDEPAAPPEPRVFRIPCPQGHVLETPSDMIGQQALCPYCNTQFELRYEDSEEYEQDMAEAKLRREEQINAAWVKWSIRLAILVGVMFVAMIVYMMVQ